MSKNDPLSRLPEGDVRDIVVDIVQTCKDRGFILERDPNFEYGRYGPVAKPIYTIRRGTYMAMQLSLDKEEGKTKRSPAYAALQAFLERTKAELGEDVEFEARMEVFKAHEYDTYAFGDQMRALGGRWNRDLKQWEIPADKAELALEIAKPHAYISIAGYLVPKSLNDLVRSLGGRWSNGSWMITQKHEDRLQNEIEKAQQLIAATKQAEADAGILEISKGEGYGGEEYSVGDVIRHKDAWYTVIKASKHYYRDDGMSFGVGDESGYVFIHKLRPSTPEEYAAPEARRLASLDLKAKAKIISDSLNSGVFDRKLGVQPWGENDEKLILEGETVNIGDGKTIYGGGEWFLMHPEWIWHVNNNGADGDNWSLNNIRTGGAGAIGFRFEHTPERDEIVSLSREIYGSNEPIE